MKNFSIPEKTLKEVEETFRKVDSVCNRINEKTGFNIRSEEMYMMVIYELNPNISADEVDLKHLYMEVEEILWKNLPELLNESVPQILENLRLRNPHATVGILSNTGFIKGETLRNVLCKLELDKYFDFQLYSDEIGFSKPNPDFFGLMLDRVRDKHVSSVILPSDILHVGDNFKADIEGSRMAGMDGFWVSSEGGTLLDLVA